MMLPAPCSLLLVLNRLYLVLIFKKRGWRHGEWFWGVISQLLCRKRTVRSNYEQFVGIEVIFITSSAKRFERKIKIYQLFKLITWEINVAPFHQQRGACAGANLKLWATGLQSSTFGPKFESGQKFSDIILTKPIKHDSFINRSG